MCQLRYLDVADTKGNLLSIMPPCLLVALFELTSNAGAAQKWAQMHTYKHGPCSLQPLQKAHVSMQQLQRLLGGGRPADPWQPRLLGIEAQLRDCLRQQCCQL